MGATPFPSERPTDLSVRLDPPERLFTVEEANRLLPAIEAILHEMDARSPRLQEVSDLVQDLEEYWGGRLADGDLPERGRYLELVRERDEAQEALNRDLERVRGMGVLLKDFQTGLVDFYGIVAGELVFLCWQRGESSVRFYHTLQGGFAARKPLALVP
jgi:hypothetical protein